jgi:tricarballylate dehydrogenase
VTLSASTDVLIVGGGNAALCAAIAAREAGADVVVLEHAPKQMRGGNTRHTRNLRAMHDGPVHTLSGTYDEEEYWQDLLRVTGGETNETLARLMIRESEKLLDWLHDRGVRFQPALRGTLSLDRTNAFFLGGGKALLNAEFRTAESLGVEVHYDCEVRSLDIADGGFRAARVIHGGVDQFIEARAVVVASGGFQANEGWMREAWGSAADNFIIRGTPYNRGTVLRDLMGKGAVTVGDPTQCHAVAIDARAPKYDGGIASRLDCVCFSIVVNREGRRFYDEGEDFWPKRYAIWGRLVAQQPGQIAYAVIDSKVVQQFMPSVFPEIRAESIDALADAIDVPVETLNKTVDTFNDGVVAGDYDPAALDDCHTVGVEPPKSHWALPLDAPPFYAYPLRPGITFTYLGLKVDDDARVEFENERVNNVFAAGEVMAGNILGQGYCAGTGMTIGAVFGRIAGERAAERAQDD